VSDCFISRFYKIRWLCLSDEPKSAKKPVRNAAPSKRPPLKQRKDSTNTNADRPASSLSTEPPSLGDSPYPHAKSISTPIGCKITQPKSTALKSKKATEEAEQASRESYAQELFDELNKSVFGNGLPENTKLNWNKRLLTTAGKAKYRRYVFFSVSRII